MVTALSIYLVFSVDQHLRGDEGSWPYDNLLALVISVWNETALAILTLGRL